MPCFSKFSVPGDLAVDFVIASWLALYLILVRTLPFMNVWAEAELFPRIGSRGLGELDTPVQ